MDGSVQINNDAFAVYSQKQQSQAAVFEGIKFQTWRFLCSSIHYLSHKSVNCRDDNGMTSRNAAVCVSHLCIALELPDKQINLNLDKRLKQHYKGSCYLDWQFISSDELQMRIVSSDGTLQIAQISIKSLPDWKKQKVNAFKLLCDRNWIEQFQFKVSDILLNSTNGELRLFLIVHPVVDTYVDGVIQIGLLACRLLYQDHTFTAYNQNNRSKQKDINVERFIRAIQPSNADDSVNDVLQHDEMETSLLDFQKRSLQWMLSRELVAVNNDGQVQQQKQLITNYSWCQFNNAFVQMQSGNVSISGRPQCDCTKFGVGGILAEEMGLGKTIITLALVLWNRRPDKGADQVNATSNSKIYSGATLIFVPSQILYQWVEEIEKHTPTLRYAVYDGIKSDMSDQDYDEYLHRISEMDIVIASYDNCGRDLARARPDNARSRRHERKYDRPKTIFTTISWWRLVCDEAQMIENSYSNAAELTSYIERVNTWAVTGTPFQNRQSSLNDLKGVYRYLGLQDLFSAVCHDEDSLIEATRFIMRRNAKSAVQQELHLPDQISRQYMLHFDEIEAAYYASLITELKKRNIVTAKSSASADNTDDNINFNEKKANELYGWVLCLRQTCSHYQAGTQNKRIFGETYKTLDEALQIMLEGERSEVLSIKRQIIAFKVRQGMLHEVQKDFNSALEIYLQLSQDADSQIRQLQQDLMQLKELKAREKRLRLADENDNGENVEDSSDSEAEQFDDLTRYKGQSLGGRQSLDFHHMAQKRLQSWQMLNHQILYCIGSVYFQRQELETDEQLKKESHLLSDSYYNKAEDLRKSLTGRAEIRIQNQINSLDSYQNDKSISDDNVADELNCPPPVIGGGLQTQQVYAYILMVIEWLNDQAVQIQTFRQNSIKGACDGLHQNYAEDAVNQDHGHMNQDFYAACLSIRKQMVSGIVSISVRQIMALNDSVQMKQIDQQEDTSTDVSIKLPGELQQPLEVNLPLCVKELKLLKQRVNIADVEREIIKQLVDYIADMQQTQSEVLQLLEGEVSQLSKIWNRRIQFYTILQKLSDQVVLPVVSGENVALRCSNQINEIAIQIEQVNDALLGHQSKLNYLQNLVESSGTNLSAQQSIQSSGSDRLCEICHDQLSEELMIAPCGHVFHKECLSTWLKIKMLCPLCKRRVMLSEVKEVSDSQRQLTSHGIASSSSKASQIIPLDSQVRDLQDMVRRVSLKGSFGTKVNMISKHIKLIITESPGQKIVLFSQWADILNLFQTAFSSNDIKGLRLDPSLPKKQRSLAIQQFKEDYSCNVLMLNSKSQSSGLTLTCATHVFIVEPSLNLAMEQQALARVHRLGQKNVTHAHYYVLSDSIEEEILRMRGNSQRSCSGKSENAQNNKEAIDQSVAVRLLQRELVRLDTQDRDNSTSSSRSQQSEGQRLLRQPASESRNQQ
ncbi:hypothetical protein MP228_001131 [Amoeboaphelidium protococcarum]|nr:hypothetical protein MP228_001131 [Amoeboaphelidium protococcarum]